MRNFLPYGNLKMNYVAYADELRRNKIQQIVVKFNGLDQYSKVYIDRNELMVDDDVIQGVISTCRSMSIVVDWTGLQPWVNHYYKGYFTIMNKIL